MQGTFRGALETPANRLRMQYSTKTLRGDPVHPECVAAVEKTAKALSALGHVVEEYPADKDLGVEEMMQAWTRIVACGTALSVKTALAGKTLDPSLIEGVTQGAIDYAETISGSDYLASVNQIHAFGRRMAGVFLDCDALITPTLATPPIEIGKLKPDNQDFVDYRNGPGGVFEYSPFTAIFNASGQPAVSLPLHWSTDNLPVGVHVAMAFGDDEKLMGLSSQLEQALPWWDWQQTLIDRGGVIG